MPAEPARELRLWTVIASALAESVNVLRHVQRTVDCLAAGETASAQHAELDREFVRDTDVDVVLCAGRHTLLDHSALTDLLPAALERGRSVVIGGAFNSGLLADPRPGATYDYARAPAGLVDRALRIQAAAERHGTTLRAAALAFCASHRAVASVLVGARSAAEVHDCADQFTTPVPAALWQELHATGLLPYEGERP